MTNIYLVRHAEVEYTHDDFLRPLTEKGILDTEKVTKVFKNIKVDVVISSPYIRAIDTIEGIAIDKGLDILIINDFRERKVSDVFIDDFNTFSLRQWENFDYALDNGESLKQVQERGIKALNSILKQYKDNNIVIGTHGTILSTILNYYDRSYDYNFWKTLKMPDIFRLEFEDKKIVNIKRIELMM